MTMLDVQANIQIERAARALSGALDEDKQDLEHGGDDPSEAGVQT